MTIKDASALAQAICTTSPSYMEVNAKVATEMQVLMDELKMQGL